MNEYTTEQIRNIALVGHSGTGKTSLTEALAYTLKVTDRLGNVEEANTLSDYDQEEAKRHISINTSLIPLECKGHKLNLFDTPGYRDFVGETKNAVRVADGLLIVLDATAGVEVGTELAWDYADEYEVPRAFFINKLDKERADFDAVVASITQTFEKDIAILTLPIGKESGFQGVVDVLKMKSVTEKDRKTTLGQVPDDLKAKAEEYRKKLIELAAEGDDDLTMKYLEEETLSDEEIAQGLKEGIVAGKLIPVLCGSASLVMGINPLLELLVHSFPSPSDRKGFAIKSPDGTKELVRTYSADEPFSAFVFKTVSDAYAGRLTFFKVISGEMRSDTTVQNVNKKKDEKITHLLIVQGRKQENVHKLAAGDIGAVAKLSVTATNDTLCDPASPVIIEATRLPSRTLFMAVSTKSKGDEEKIGLLMHKMIEQDPTLQLRRDPEIRQTLLSGMGNIQLEVAVSRLKTNAGIDVNLEVPRVAYRETIIKKAEGQGKFKKQSGGRGQYGDVWLRLEPLPRGTGFEFVWEIVGGVIPTKYQPSVEKGIVEAMEKGILAGYQSMDIKASCYFGSYHSVDSSDIAFKVAGTLAFQNVAANAEPIVLEPVMNVMITVPETNMGDIMGDMSGRRGKIMGSEQKSRKVIIQAQVPQDEMYTYSQDLNSMTQGRGFYELSFSHYERVPGDIQEKIIAESKARKEAAKE